jgi:tetratricopeptide (TPR) repeat protein
MAIEASENSFRRGLRAVNGGDLLEGLAYFEAALQLARRHGPAAVPVRYLSYYGWCLAACSDRAEEARELCEKAVRAEFFNPDLHWNLGRVYLMTGDRHRAFETVVRGLELNPRHAGLKLERRRLGFRKESVVRFFQRSHPLNRFLGRVRRRLQEGGFRAPLATG